MQFCKFIECRLGEPLTALDVHRGHVAVGSISGYYVLYSVEHNLVYFSKDCQKEAIRDITLHIGARHVVNKIPKPPKEDNSEDSDDDYLYHDQSDEDIKEKFDRKWFQDETGEWDLVYINVGDLKCLRVDIRKFFEERIKQQSEKVNGNHSKGIDSLKFSDLK